MPATAVGHLEKDNFLRPEGIESLEGYRSYHRTDEALPHGFVWEIVGKLLVLL